MTAEYVSRGHLESPVALKIYMMTLAECYIPDIICVKVVEQV